MSEPVVEGAPVERSVAPAPGPAPAPVDISAVRADATAAERARVAEITKLSRGVKLDEFGASLVESGVTVEEARSALLSEIAKRDLEFAKPRGGGITGTDIGADSFRSGMVDAILHRADPHRFKADESSNRFRGLSLADMAREVLTSEGASVRGLNRFEVVSLALGLSGRTHSSSDFPNILADAVNKSLRAAYTARPQSFAPFVRRVSVSDFKAVKRNQLGDAPTLLPLGEHGEVTYGTIGEGKETYSIGTFARSVTLTRVAIVNDDLDAFSRLPLMFTRATRSLESKLVYDQILSNPTMGDGVALFHATHGNLGSGVIDVTSVGAGRAAMRKQKGLNGEYIEVDAAFLLTSEARRTVAEQFVGVITPNQISSANPFSGRLTNIPEPRLDEIAPEPWFLVASPSDIDTIELANLEGTNGPEISSEVSFETEGLKLKCRYDVGAKVIDWRGFYKSTGV